jgi:hypothetical protein
MMVSWWFSNAIIVGFLVAHVAVNNCSVVFLPITVAAPSCLLTVAISVVSILCSAQCLITLVFVSSYGTVGVHLCCVCSVDNQIVVMLFRCS